MSEKIKAVPTDAEVQDETQTTIVVDWKRLGKKVAIYGGILTGGLLVGYLLAQDSTDLDEEDTETDDTETPEV